MLKEKEGGAKTADDCRKHGISAATFYKFKAKFGGMEVSDARRLKALEDENTRLKKLLAEQMPDNAILKDVAVQQTGDRSSSRRRRPTWAHAAKLMERRNSRRLAVKSTVPSPAISASSIQTEPSPAPRNTTASAKARKWRDGSAKVSRCTNAGWLSIAPIPPESMMIGMITMITSRANCAVLREARFGHLSFGAADFEIGTRDDIASAQCLSAVAFASGEGDARLHPGHTRKGGGHRRLGARFLRVEFSGIHDGKNVACRDEVALLCRNCCYAS